MRRVARFGAAGLVAGLLVTIFKLRVFSLAAAAAAWRQLLFSALGRLVIFALVGYAQNIRRANMD